MKKRVLSGRHWDWLDRWTVRTGRVEREFCGWAALLDIQSVNRKPMAAIEGRGPVCLADARYRWLVFLPDGEYWCLTALYDEAGQIIQWYFDITAGSCLSCGEPAFFDLYLDVVLSPDGEVLILDQDELDQALARQDISPDLYHLAQRACDQVLREAARGPAFFDAFCQFCIEWLEPLPPRPMERDRMK